MPGEPGSFNLRSVMHWYTAKHARTRTGSDELRAVDIRLKTAMAEAKELENAKEAGGLVDVADVDRWAATIMVLIRETFAAFPERLLPSIPVEQKDFVRGEANKCVRDILSLTEQKLSEHDYFDDDLPEHEEDE